MSVRSVLRFDMTTTETLETNVGGLSANNRRNKYDAYDESLSLGGGSTPPVTKSAFFLLTLTAGEATINLAALTGTNGAAVDGTGLRVQAIRVKNLGSNPMTFAEGASNGIALACGDFTVAPGGIDFKFLNDAAPDIASGDRTLDVTGTGTETAEMSILMG